MKLSKNIEWFRPYLDKVSHLVPLNELDKIISIKPRKNQVKKHHAQLVENYNDGVLFQKYISINLYSWRLVGLAPAKRTLLPFSKIDLLNYLAHELAHLVDWNHTPRHNLIQSQITIIFMEYLESTGYISEENELQYNPPKY